MSIVKCVKQMMVQLWLVYCLTFFHLIHWELPAEVDIHISINNVTTLNSMRSSSYNWPTTTTVHSMLQQFQTSLSAPFSDPVIDSSVMDSLSDADDSVLEEEEEEEDKIGADKQQQQPMPQQVKQQSSTLLRAAVAVKDVAVDPAAVTAAATKPLTAKQLRKKKYKLQLQQRLQKTPKIEFLNSPKSCQPKQQQTTKKVVDQHDHRLELLHVPKTGGTALEIAAARHKVHWGACHWMNWTICPPHAPRPRMKDGVPRWHLPVKYLMNDPKDFHPYDDAADLFVVVRDPYARVVSQWNYMKTKGFYGDGRPFKFKRNSKEHMNTFVQTVMKQVYRVQRQQQQQSYAGDTDDQTDTTSAESNSTRHHHKRLDSDTITKLYFQQDGHFIPQYDYVVDNNVKYDYSSAAAQSALSSPKHQQQLPLHVRRKVLVLKQEQLNSEFNCLMKRYQLDHLIKLKVVHNNNNNNNNNHGPPTTAKDKKSAATDDRHNTKKGKLRVQDLTRESMEWIERVYRLDFVTFGYPLVYNTSETIRSSSISQDDTPTTTTSSSKTTTTTTTTLSDTNTTMSEEDNDEEEDESEDVTDDVCAPIPIEDLTRLELLHIPRTAGSTLTMLASLNGNTAWGLCHFANRKKCPKHVQRLEEHSLYRLPFWHVPIQYMKKGYNPYANAAVFTVVRNPYDRMVSHWKSLFSPDNSAQSSWYKRSSASLSAAAAVQAMIHQYTVDSADHMNEYLQIMLQKRLNITTMTTTAVSKDYFASNGQFIPQADYVVGAQQHNHQRHSQQQNQQQQQQLPNNNNNSSTTTTIKDVTILHFETLADDFACLMQRYHMAHLSLLQEEQDGDDEPPRFMESKGRLTSADLTARTRQLIQQVFPQDFEWFGYDPN